MVVKGNCPIFDVWTGDSKPAASTQNQVFPPSVPDTADIGTVQAIKCPIKTTARSFNLSDFQP